MHAHTTRLTWLMLGLLVGTPDAPIHAQRSAAVRDAAPQVAVAPRAASLLRGVVRDESGSPVAGARVTISDGALGEPRMVLSDAQGRFAFESLPAGRVDLRCEAAGFVALRREGVQVAPQQPTSLDLTLRRVAVTASPRPSSATPSISGRGAAPGGAPRPAEATAGSRPDQGSDSGAGAAGPPSESPGSLPRHELLQRIDEYLARMDPGRIGFNAPDSMRMGETTQIRLVLSPDMSAAAIREQLRGLPGVPQTAEIRIAPEMEAVLTGQQFTITAITPAAQVVSREGPTEWRWEVSPATPGAHRLHLVMNALILDSSRTLRTFEHTIDVNVPPLADRVSVFVGDNWQWLWATAIAPLVGWLWTRWSAERRRRRVPE